MSGPRQLAFGDLYDIEEAALAVKGLSGVLLALGECRQDIAPGVMLWLAGAFAATAAQLEQGHERLSAIAKGEAPPA